MLDEKTAAQLPSSNLGTWVRCEYTSKKVNK